MDYLSVVSALSLIAALLLLLLWFSRRLPMRFAGGASGRRLEIVERIRVGEKSSILLLRVRDREILVGATSSSISALSTLNSGALPMQCPQASDEVFPRGICNLSEGAAGARQGAFLPAAGEASQVPVQSAFRKLFSRLLEGVR